MFLDYVLNQTDTETVPKLGRTIQVTFQGFKQMFSYNSVDRRVANPWLIEKCATAFQKHVTNGVR